jgi:hypothetical protein
MHEDSLWKIYAEAERPITNTERKLMFIEAKQNKEFKERIGETYSLRWVPSCEEWGNYEVTHNETDKLYGRFIGETDAILFWQVLEKNPRAILDDFFLLESLKLCLTTEEIDELMGN